MVKLTRMSEEYGFDIKAAFDRRSCTGDVVEDIWRIQLGKMEIEMVLPENSNITIVKASIRGYLERTKY